MAELKELLQQMLDQLDQERKEVKERNAEKKENAGWMVQYQPCGHFHELAWNDPQVEKAKIRAKAGYLDALTRPIEECPICHAQHLSREREFMYQRLEGMSNRNLEIVWDCLRNYDPHEQYAPGISMDDWAQVVHTEMDHRGIPHIKPKAELA